MRPRRAVTRRPLDRIFAAPSHVAILRALLDSAEGMSGRQVARLADVNHQACAAALGRLEEIGVVRRQGSGQSQLFHLNREQILVRELVLPLLTRERRLFAILLRRMRELVAGRCVRAILFGSVARGEERADSDLDLLLIAADPVRKRTARDAGDRVRRMVATEWGLQVNPVVLTEAEVTRRRKRGDPLIANVLREGIELDQAKNMRAGHAKTRTAPAG